MFRAAGRPVTRERGRCGGAFSNARRRAETKIERFHRLAERATEAAPIPKAESVARFIIAVRSVTPSEDRCHQPDRSKGWNAKARRRGGHG